MAGSWIKMRHDLIDAPEVRRIARACGLDRDQVYGKLFRLWSWADRHGHNGRIDADQEDVDEQVGHPGFAATLVSVGWLEIGDGIVIPHWDRHNSDSAKIRGLKATRMRKSRGAPCATDVATPVAQVAPQGCVTPVAQVAPPEKTRGEKNNPPPPPRAAAQDEDTQTLMDAWAVAVRQGHVQPWNASSLPDTLPARLAEPGWAADAVRAIQWLPRCRYFDAGKVTLLQLCGPGFVSRVLGHQYDDAKPAKRSRTPAGDEKAPPRVFVGRDADRFAATLAKSMRLKEEDA